MIKSLFQRNITDYLLLITIIFIYGINTYYLTSLDAEPPKWDEAVHLRDSFVFHYVISEPSQLNLQVIKEIINKSEQYPLLRPSGYYPPLAPLVTSFFYFIFEISVKTAVMTNLVFLLILVFSVYKTGAFLFDRIIGLLASILMLLFPNILQHSVIYYLDLPLTAFTALSIYVILKSEFFTDVKFSVVAGFCFGLGMLTKWTFLFFIIGPLIYLIVKTLSLTSEKKDPGQSFNKSKQLKNIILFSAAALFTFGLYYFPILSQLLQETFKYSKGPLSHGPDTLFSFESIAFYFRALWKEMITPLGFVLFITGTIFLSFSKNKYKIFLFVTTIVPYLIFAFAIQTKSPRFMMPWLIPVSLIIAFGIKELAAIKFLKRDLNTGRYIVIISIVFFCLFFFFENKELKESLIRSSKKDWKINKIVSVIEKDLKTSQKMNQLNKVLYLGTIPDHEFINGQTIRYYAAIRKLPLNVIKLQDYSNTAHDKFIRQFDRYDYIITKNKLNIVKPAFQQSVNNMNDFFYSNIKNFDCLATFYEPDGSKVSVFKRIK